MMFFFIKSFLNIWSSNQKFSTCSLLFCLLLKIELKLPTQSSYDRCSASVGFHVWLDFLAVTAGRMGWEKDFLNGYKVGSKELNLL